MTIRLEGLGDGSVSDRNFQKLMALVLDTGGRSVGIRFATVTFTFTASATSGAINVSHGLGRAPVAVGVFSWIKPGVANGNAMVHEGTITASLFTCTAVAAAAWTGTIQTSWVAIG